jgi:hypothetical protein
MAMLSRFTFMARRSRLRVNRALLLTMFVALLPAKPKPV